ncbi:MAG: ADP-ribosylation factor-like protein [Anaerolineales bacterium]
MHINWQLRELNLKIVYYGPALSGKTTNIEQIHSRIDPRHRSELVSLKTHEDRTLFFDFMQIELGRINNLVPKIYLYTVPGQTYYEASRKIVLRGADGIVFVADSSPERANANVVSWEDMESHLASFDLSMDQIPIVLQCNKQDVLGALTPAAIKYLLHTYSIPTSIAVATHGEGVFDTLKMITLNVISSIQKQMVVA